MGHDYLCACAACNYERSIKNIREKYSMQSEPQFIQESWARKEAKREAFRQAYSSNSTTGRFKVNRPNTEQTPRHPGQYRRVKDDALNVINWQYKPWPGGDWETYFTVTQEMLTRMNNPWNARQHNMNAHKALQEKRYYKIERVDQTA